MTESDLETVVARTGHERYRWLTSDDNPDAESREGYRRIVREMAAAGEPAPPSLVERAASVTKAAATFAASGFATVDRAEFDRRHAVCEGCEHFDASHNKCRICTCNLAVKPWGRDMHCPVEKW